MEEQETEDLLTYQDRKNARPLVILFTRDEGKVVIVAPVGSFKKQPIDEAPPRSLTPFLKHLAYPVYPTPLHVCDFYKPAKVRQYAPIPAWTKRRHNTIDSPDPDNHTAQYVLLGKVT